MGLSDEQALRQLIHGQRPEGIDGRQLARRKTQRIVVGAVEFLPVGIDIVGRVDGFFLTVAPDAENGGRHAVEVIVLQVFPCAEGIAGTDLARLCPFLQLRKVCPGIVDALTDGFLDFRGEPVPVEGLAGADIEFGKTGHELLLGRMRGAELQHEIQLLEDLGRFRYLLTRQRLDEVDRRCRLGRRFAEKRGKGLHLVAGLDGLHLFEVVGIEELGPVDGNHQFGFGADDFRDAVGNVALPAGPGEEEMAALVAGVRLPM